MKILFLSDNYPPEVNAPAVRSHFHCREWVRLGASVTVITCAPNFPQGVVYPGYRNRLFQREEREGVEVIRVWSYLAPNQGVVRRTLDYLSYAAMATLAGVSRDFDVVVATSPQFFTAVAGDVIARWTGRPWVFEIRDLWPESIVATGAMSKGPAITALERLEQDLYQSADLLVPVTHSFRDHVMERGVPADRIRVVTNGVDPDEFRIDSPKRTDPDGPLVVGYLGTHGMAHGLDLVLRAAQLLDPAEVRFELVGDGAEKRRLVDEAKRLGLDHVVFSDPVPREQVAAVLAGFDAALIPLRDTAAFRSVIPSKIFEAAAASVPMLLGVRGEAEGIVRRYDAGLVFSPEREEELVRAIQRIRGEEGLLAKLQEGCGRLVADYDRSELAVQMLTHLKDVVGASSR